MTHQPSSRRAGFDALGNGHELDSPTGEVIEDGEKVAEGSAKTIQLPNDECISRLEFGETLGQFHTTTITAKVYGHLDQATLKEAAGVLDTPPRIRVVSQNVKLIAFREVKMGWKPHTVWVTERRDISIRNPEINWSAVHRSREEK